jgi:signal transduction histidine kinase
MSQQELQHPVADASSGEGLRWMLAVAGAANAHVLVFDADGAMRYESAKRPPWLRAERLSKVKRRALDALAQNRSLMNTLSLDEIDVGCMMAPTGNGEVVVLLQAVSDPPEDCPPNDAIMPRAMFFRENGGGTAAEETASAAAACAARFLTMMSHELRTPLNGILGFTDLLAKQYFGPLNEKQASYVYRIEHSGQHLLALVSDLLDIARIDAGRLGLQRQGFLIEECLNPVIERQTAALIERNVKLEYEPQSYRVYGDMRKCRQVMECVLRAVGNSVQAGGKVALKTRESNADDIEVLAEAVQPEGLKPQAPQNPLAAGEIFDGSICYNLAQRIIALHGGRLEAMAENGQPSYVLFTLPKAASELVTRDRGRLSEDESAEDRAQGTA